MRAPAHFEAPALITFADRIDLDGIAVAFAKGTDCTELQCFIGWVHSKAHGQVCLDPGIDLVFHRLFFLWGELVVVEVEAQALSGDVAPVLLQIWCFQYRAQRCSE